MRNILKSTNINNYFIDTTYKIIPKFWKKYKLMTISAYNKEIKATNIACLILYEYEDAKSLYYIFKYLNEFFQFNPNIINVDFGIAQRNALLEKNLFKEDPIIISCFFHFSQCIYRKMKQYKMINTKLTKYSFEILRNIELICFINPKLLKKYDLFLKNKLISEKEKKLYTYVKNTWLKKDHKLFNYYKLIEENDYILDHLYLTNNIAENLHRKLNYYIPKKKLSNYNFIYAITNIIINGEIKNSSIVRRDYISKALIKIAKNTISDPFSWIKFENFKSIEKDIIKSENKILNINNVEQLIKSINDIEISSKSENKSNLDCIDINKLEENLISEYNNINLSDDNEEESFDNSEDSDYNGNSDPNPNSDDGKDIKDVSDIIHLKSSKKDRLNTLLLDRLLKKEEFNNYSDLIKDTINKRNGKRSEPTNNDDDIKLFKKDNKGKKKIIYPKKNNSFIIFNYTLN